MNAFKIVFFATMGLIAAISLAYAVCGAAIVLFFAIWSRL
jgi:hypothetical protein